MGRGGRKGTVYRIRVKGVLDEAWGEWFEDAALSYEEGATVLTYEAADQAALQGVLRQLYALGIPLISVNPVEGEIKEEQG